MTSLTFRGTANPPGHAVFGRQFESQDALRFSRGTGFSYNSRVSKFKNHSRNLCAVAIGRKCAGIVRVSSCLATDAIKEASSLEDGVKSGIGFDGGSRGIIEDEGKYFVGNYARSPVVFVRGHGCKLYDVEGKEYLDLTAGIAVNALGHGDPAWVKAVTEQAATLTHVSNMFHSVPQVHLGHEQELTIMPHMFNLET
ncbi:hypothetical protein KI387_018188, partial [Taxus chinensis]